MSEGECPDVTQCSKNCERDYKQNSSRGETWRTKYYNLAVTEAFGSRE